MDPLQNGNNCEEDSPCAEEEEEVDPRIQVRCFEMDPDVVTGSGDIEMKMGSHNVRNN